MDRCGTAWYGACGQLHRCSRQQGHIDNVGTWGIPGPVDDSRHVAMVDGAIASETYPAVTCKHD